MSKKELGYEDVKRVRDVIETEFGEEDDNWYYTEQGNEEGAYRKSEEEFKENWEDFNDEFDVDFFETFIREDELEERKGKKVKTNGKGYKYMYNTKTGNQEHHRQTGGKQMCKGVCKALTGLALVGGLSYIIIKKKEEIKELTDKSKDKLNTKKEEVITKTKDVKDTVNNKVGTSAVKVLDKTEEVVSQVNTKIQDTNKDLVKEAHSKVDEISNNIDNVTKKATKQTSEKSGILKDKLENLEEVKTNNESKNDTNKNKTKSTEDKKEDKKTK